MPVPFNGRYQLPSWPPTTFNRDLWNAVFGSIADRLSEREALEATFESLIAQGTQASLDYIQATIAPQIASLQTAIANAEAEVADIIASGVAPDAAKLGGQLPAWYAPKASPAFTGIATAATAALGTATGQLATTAFVKNEIDALKGGASSALDTLKEIEDKLASEDNAVAALTAVVAQKANTSAIADMATKTGVETLTNKTLTSPKITGPLPQTVNSVFGSVSGNALSVGINPGAFDFRSTTLNDGSPTRVELANAATLTVPAGATLGTSNGNVATLVILACNNGGTIVPAVANLAGGLNLDETGLISTTAMSAAATSVSAIYSAAALTNVAYRVVGYVEIVEATAGTWATAPYKIQGGGGLSLLGLGSVQTWQNPGYAVGTTYFNTTNKKIDLKIEINPSSSAQIYATINGVSVGGVVGGYNASGTQMYVGYLGVPPRSSFSFSTSAGIGAYAIWRLA